MVENSLLAISLSAAIPLHIYEIKASGGPSEYDFNEAKKIGQLIASKGDNLLFRSKKKGETAHIFNMTARAIATLSFLPGGIKIFNTKYESKSNNTRRVKSSLYERIKSNLQDMMT